jgi:hypothetical protein
MDEYRAIADSSKSSAVVARALNAQAWVLSRKMDRRAAGDSLFWIVVREHPGTEAQVAARDYLEADGQSVPASLIVPPKEPTRPLFDLKDSLSRPPGATPGPGARTSPFADPTRLGSSSRAGMVADSMRRVRALHDTLLSHARLDTSAAGRARVDSLRRAFLRPDTTGNAAIMAEIERDIPRPEGVVLGPDDAPPPTLESDPDAERVRLEGATPITKTTLPEERGVEGLAPVPLVTDSAGHDTTRAGRARSRTMDWFTGGDLTRARRVAPGETPMPSRFRTDSTGARHALVPDSLRKGSSPSDSSSFENSQPDETGVRPPVTPAEPKPVPPRAITSFERKDKATKLREREERLRAKVVRDSLNLVKKAQREVEKKQRAAAKKQKGKKPATPPAPVLPDTAAIGKARRDSLEKLVAPPAAPPPVHPDTTKRDSSSSPRR